MRATSLALVLFLSLVGCGKNNNYHSYTPAGTSASGSGQLNLQGYYILPDGGWADVVNDTGNLQDVVSMRLMVRNADSSSGMIPIASVLNLPTVGSEVHYTASVTYAALHNVKTDAGNTQLVGSFVTFLTLSRNSSGLLTIRVKISSPTALVFDHVVTEE